MGKRILILTDSLGLPREVPEQCAYEDTWPILLKGKEYNVLQVSIGGATTKDIITEGIMSDCVCLNALGHAFVYRLVFRELDKMFLYD